MGNYERFVDVTLTRDHNITTGKIYSAVLEKERRGEYLGKTVQVVPHVTDAVQDWITRVAALPVDGSEGCPDVCVIELGGTVGDIESMPFVEAIRQFQFRVGPGNLCLIHVSLVPVLGVVGEQKTKPTQHSVQVLRSLGLAPHMLACRSQDKLEDNVKEKLALFCNVGSPHILTLHDVSNIWHVPLIMRDQGAVDSILNILQLPPRTPDLDGWANRAQRWDTITSRVAIAMVGKYTGLSDAYLSVIKSLEHACIACNFRLDLRWVDAGALEEAAKGKDPAKYEAAWATVRQAAGILVPGGFGDRGVEGKIAAAKYARESGTPYLGICLGMQVAVIEAARSLLGYEDAHSTEFASATPHPAVVFMPEGSKTHMGGTMRLGVRRTQLQTVDCLAAKLYQREAHIDERHRHRYEVNPEMVPALEGVGCRFVGRDDTGRRMEILEMEGHPFFFATQYHPEFKSRPGKPSPPFLGLILAATGKLDAFFGGTAPLKSPSRPFPSPAKAKLARDEALAADMVNGSS